MEKKKFAFIDLGPRFHPDTYFLCRYLRELCDLEVTDVEHADYVVFSDNGSSHWQVPDRCIKIYYTTEDLAPDFNACDYALTFEWMQYGDRHSRLPLYYWYPDICELMERKHLQPFSEVKAQKQQFCSITVSNGNRHPMFVNLFDTLSSFRQVDSGGRWRNNVGGPIASKLDFDRSHKFSIVCENTAHSGYTTEKLVEAFAAGCIPIYWGDPDVAKVFNPKAMINVSDFPTLAALSDYVRKVDADDALWQQMIAEPALLDTRYGKEQQLAALFDFLRNIISQPLEQAQRRNRLMWGRLYLDDRCQQTRSWDFRLWKTYHRWAYKLKTKLKFHGFSGNRCSRGKS